MDLSSRCPTHWMEGHSVTLRRWRTRPWGPRTWASGRRRTGFKCDWTCQLHIVKSKASSIWISDRRTCRCAGPHNWCCYSWEQQQHCSCSSSKPLTASSRLCCIGRVFIVFRRNWEKARGAPSPPPHGSKLWTDGWESLWRCLDGWKFCLFGWSRVFMAGAQCSNSGLCVGSEQMSCCCCRMHVTRGALFC